MTDHYGVLVYDIESDGLLSPWEEGCATKLHCICATDHAGNIFIYVDKDRKQMVEHWLEGQDQLTRVTLGEFKDFLDLIPKYEAIACHNQLTYDLPMLEKFLGLEYSISPSKINGVEIKIIDTLIESRMMHPDRQLAKGCPSSIPNPVTGRKDIVGPHGLAAWAYRTGGTKPVVHDWRNQHITTYVERCIEDVKNNLLTFDALTNEIARWYKTGTDPKNWEIARKKASLAWNIEHYFAHIIFKQQERGVQFDQELAKKHVKHLDSWIEELENKWEPTLPETDIPPSRLERDFKIPARLVLRNGGLSTIATKFMEKWNAEYSIDENHNLTFTINDVTYQEPFPKYVTTKEPLRLKNSAGIKEYLMARGWSPSLWNYKRCTITKRLYRDENRKLVPTTPRIKDAASGHICENLLNMDDEFAQDYVLYSTLKHRRQSILSPVNDSGGWLNHPRLAYDGKLPAEANTIGTPTKRCTHRIVANVPKPEDSVVYGKEMRRLFTVGEGYYFLNYDASGLEARLDGHEAYPYDKGAYGFELLEGDVHQKNTDAINSLPFMKGREITRSQSKGIKYGLTYGAQAGKIAQMLNITLDEAKHLLEAYWEENWATKAAIEKYKKDWERSGKKYITDITGAPLWIRAEHSIYNARLQNAGSMAVKLSTCILHQDLEKAGYTEDQACQIIHYHDEASFAIRKDLVTFIQLKNEEEGAKLQKEQYTSKPFKNKGQWLVAKCHIGELAVKSIEKASKILKVKVPLTGEWILGKTWEAH